MKLGTLKVGIIGNVLKIRGNLDRICGSWEFGGGGAGEEMKQNELDTALKSHFNGACLLNFPSKQNIYIFRGYLTEFRGSFYLRQNYAN